MNNDHSQFLSRLASAVVAVFIGMSLVVIGLLIWP